MESANDQKLQRHGSNRGIRSPTDVQKAVERKNSAGYISSVQNRKDDFLEMCLGGPDAVFEHMVDQQEKGDKENMIEISKDLQQQGKSSPCSDSKRINLDADDDEDARSIGSHDSDGIDLEDMFAFEPETLSKLVKEGASMSRLTVHLQAAYADALERRLASANTRSSETADIPPCADDHVSGDSTPRPELQAGNVSKHMTPENLTPVTSPRSHTDCNEHSTGQLATFGGHALVEAVFVAQQRSRRSAAVRRRPSALKREHAAVKAVEAYGRRSLAGAKAASPQEVELLENAVQSVVKTASRRHRRSIDKAVEVLECMVDSTEKPLEGWSDEKVDSTVDVIQGAMVEAIKRHRRSIAEAVQEVECPKIVRFEENGTGPDADGSVDARIKRAVSKAYSQQGAECSGK
jgi:hypothetical protein